MGIGTNLKKLRSKTKYSQQDVADLLQIDRITYVNWEKEVSDIKSRYIPRLAEIFGVDILDLFKNEKNQLKKTNIDQIYRSKMGGVIVININDMGNTEKLCLQIENFFKNLENN